MSQRHHREVRAGYDVIADAYLERVSRSRGSAGVQKGVKALIEEVRSLIPNGGKVADLGCGAGLPFTAVLA